jgi:uncharacterized protein
VRAVLDPNVIISALLSRRGSPARLLRAWLIGAFDLVVSEKLLAELERALSHPKLRERITSEEAAELVGLLRRHAELANDPARPRGIRSADPDDDYLIALAEDARAMLVSGDHHLLDLEAQLPVCSADEFLASIGEPS